MLLSLSLSVSLCLSLFSLLPFPVSIISIHITAIPDKNLAGAGRCGRCQIHRASSAKHFLLALGLAPQLIIEYHTILIQCNSYYHFYTHYSQSPRDGGGAHAPGRATLKVVRRQQISSTRRLTLATWIQTCIFIFIQCNLYYHFSNVSAYIRIKRRTHGIVVNKVDNLGRSRTDVSQVSCSLSARHGHKSVLSRFNRGRCTGSTAPSAYLPSGLHRK